LPLPQTGSSINPSAGAKLRATIFPSSPLAILGEPDQIGRKCLKHSNRSQFGNYPARADIDDLRLTRNHAFAQCGDQPLYLRRIFIGVAWQPK
jgi:hypothetical protein